jgi:hypothetical protein
VRCLDADKATIGSNGTKVQLFDCWHGANQNWMFNADGTIVNQASGRCLSADIGTINGDGTTVNLWDCNGQPNQQWTMNGDGTIQNRASGRNLDANGGTINMNGTKVQLWDSTGGRNQSWYQASEQSLPQVSSYTYCPSTKSATIGSIDSDLTVRSWCMTVSDAYDGTSVAPRSIQQPSCDLVTADLNFEWVSCQVTATGSFWNGTANVDYVDFTATWISEVFSFLPPDITVCSQGTEIDHDRMQVVSSPDGSRNTAEFVPEIASVTPSVCN